MPTLAPNEFWSAVSSSQLLPAEQVPQIRVACEAATGGAADTAEKQTAVAAQWLVQQRLLSLWQAKRLVRGGAGTFFVGDYRLVDRLETPATGVVFRGRHDPTKRPVALVPLDRTACQRVEVWTEVVRQTERTAATTDPLLSRTWAIEDATSGRFVVCESIFGSSLGSELAETGRWPVGEAVNAVLALTCAVAEIHRLGGVHGAISLETVIRPVPTKEVARPPLRLLQYPLTGDPLGLRAADPLRSPESLAQQGERVCFVPPERLATGEPVTPAGDVYALGCLLHALVVGRLVGWQGDAVHTAQTIRQAIASGTSLLPPPVGCPAEVSRLLTYLTAADPGRRYADAAEAADAIACCLGESPVSESLPDAQPFQENLLAVAAGAMGSSSGTEAVGSKTTSKAGSQSGSKSNRPLAFAIGGGLVAVAAVLGFFSVRFKRCRKADINGRGCSPRSSGWSPTSTARWGWSIW
jgi:serine/threonine protein kinase